MKEFKICLGSDREVKKEIAASTLEDLKLKIAIAFEVILIVHFSYYLEFYKFI